MKKEEKASLERYLLDTTVIIDVLRNQKGRPVLLKNLALEGNLLGCCCINVAEVYSGMKEKEREATEGLIESLTYFEVNKEIAKRSGEYKQRFAKKGITLTTSDAIIAAVAVTNNLILMTDNSRHFPTPELKICEP